MSIQKVNIRFSIIILIVFVTSLSRLIPYVFESLPFYNFSPIGAIGLFGAAHFANRKMAFIIPLIALWFSNLILNNVFLSSYFNGFTWFSNWSIYLIFAVIVAFGFFILKKVTKIRVLVASLGASIIFFIVSNFLVWLNGSMYPQTIEGLITCYAAAIPFFWNTLAGDIFYSALLFGTFEWAVRKIPALGTAK
jgi:hypothetical protein